MPIRDSTETSEEMVKLYEYVKKQLVELVKKELEGHGIDIEKNFMTYMTNIHTSVIQFTGQLLRDTIHMTGKMLEENERKRTKIFGDGK